jgi:hypothetical protein
MVWPQKARMEAKMFLQKTRDLAQTVEHLPNKCRALSSNLSMVKTTKQNKIEFVQ